MMINRECDRFHLYLQDMAVEEVVLIIETITKVVVVVAVAIKVLVEAVVVVANKVVHFVKDDN
jgi:hypothetical protein